MPINSESYNGAFDYDEFLKLRKMDPGRAQQYKSRKMKEYQEKRIDNQIAVAREDYARSVEKDPDNSAVFAGELRERIINIPGIDTSEKKEHKELFSLALDQINGITAHQMDIDEALSPIQGQDNMDELSADEPDVKVYHEVKTPELEESNTPNSGELETEMSIPEEEVTEKAPKKAKAVTKGWKAKAKK